MRDDRVDALVLDHGTKSSSVASRPQVVEVSETGAWFAFVPLARYFASEIVGWLGAEM
jgi:hypothetical protein